MGEGLTSNLNPDVSAVMGLSVDGSRADSHRYMTGKRFDSLRLRSYTAFCKTGETDSKTDSSTK